jgi:pimeloyl-ACP methyl ester carboxylesterase
VPSFDRPTVTLHYRDEGSGPPLLFLHGWCDSSATWADLMPRFAGEYRCVAPDMRGHGASGRPFDGACFPEALANDVAALCAHLGIERPVIVGHSFGGFLAAFIAARWPGFARAIVVIDQPVALGEFAAQMRALEAVIRSPGSHRAFREQLFDSMMGGLAGPPREGVEARSAATPPEVALALWAPLFEYDEAEIAALSERLLRALGGQPTLVLEAMEHPGYEAVVAAAAPGARFRRIPAGHWVHLERPAEFEAALREFLAEV